MYRLKGKPMTSKKQRMKTFTKEGCSFGTLLLCFVWSTVSRRFCLGDLKDAKNNFINSEGGYKYE
jgi:hypothetical protein